MEICNKGAKAEIFWLQISGTRKSANKPTFFHHRSIKGRTGEKGPGPWHYETFTRAFTSDRREIIRPVTSHNTEIMRFFFYNLFSCLFTLRHSLFLLPFLPSFLFLLLPLSKRGLRKLPEFLSSYLRPGLFFFSLSLSLSTRSKPPCCPRRFSLVLASRAFSSPRRVFQPDFFFFFASWAFQLEDKELRFSYPWVAKGELEIGLRTRTY